MNENRDSTGPHSSGPNAFYHRGYNPSANPNPNSNPNPNNTNANTNSLFAGSQGGIVAPAAMRHMPNPSITIANASTNTNANAFHSEGPTSVVPHQMPAMGMGMGMGMGFVRSEPLKRKRGRPRKYGTDGMGLGLSPVSSSHSFSDKKGRGSGKKAQMAALGSAGQGFTPHVITIAAGEDVSKKILAFLQHGPWAVCVLSANGAISNVTLRQAAMSGGTVTYEGRFEILSLSGSFLLSEVGGTRSRTGGLSVSLAGPDGRVVGGGVAGLLMAASPVQVVVGTFLADTKKGLGRVGNGEPSGGTFPASMSGCPPSPVAVQSRTEPFGGTSTGQGGHGEQNTGGSSYTLQPQVLNMISLQSMDWGSTHFEAETRSNTEAAMTGRGRTKDQDEGSQSYKNGEEEHRHPSEQFNG